MNIVWAKMSQGIPELRSVEGEGKYRLAFALSTMSKHFGKTLFAFVFLIPVFIATLFYGFIASDQFVSEVKYIVRGTNKANLGGLSSLLTTVGLSRANDESYVINRYIDSRDALKHLNETIDMRSVYTHKNADFLTSLDSIFYDESFEALYSYYQTRLILIEDVKTGITTLKSHAYTAEDAKNVAERLLQLAEIQVNRINKRAHSDKLEASKLAIKEAEESIIAAQRQLTIFRNEQLLLDPSETVKTNFSVIADLTEQLTQSEIRLQLMKRNSPSNPDIQNLENKVTSLEDQISSQRRLIVGTDDAISSKLSDYENLVLKRSLADAAYESAQNSLNLARQKANSQKIYLEPIVLPNLPDKPGEPKRLRYMLTISLVCFAIYIMLYLLVSGSREHLNLH